MDAATPTTRRRGARSHRGGAPTTLGDLHDQPERTGQLTLGLLPTASIPARREVLPGVFHIASWLDLDTQRGLAGDFRRWAQPRQDCAGPACRPVT